MWAGAPELASPGTRLLGFSFWEVLVYLLNAVLFLLVGLQLHPILSELTGSSVATLIDRLVHLPDRVDRLATGQRSSCLLLGQLPSSWPLHSTAGPSPNSSSSNSWRISISPSASGSPPASNGSRLAHSMASPIDFTWRIQ